VELDFGFILVFVGFIVNGGIIYAAIIEAAKIMSQKTSQ
jgi:hypothetical protein